MLRMLEKLGIAGPAAQARQLNADARRILVGLEGQYAAASLALVADVVRQRRDEVHELSLGKTQFYDQGLKHLTEVNAELRRANDQRGWSGTTLAIIYLRAELVGAAADPARHCIDDFLGRFPFPGAAPDPPADTAPDPPADAAGPPPALRRHRPWRD